VVSARGKQLMSWTIFLLLQPKWKLQTTFRGLKHQKVLMQSIFDKFDKLKSFWGR
jgi:hypothetical protein